MIGDRRGLAFFERLFALLIVVSFVAVALSFSLDPGKRARLLHDFVTMSRRVFSLAPADRGLDHRTDSQAAAARRAGETAGRQGRSEGSGGQADGSETAAGGSEGGPEETADLAALLGGGGDVVIVSGAPSPDWNLVRAHASPERPIPPDAGEGLTLTLPVESAGRSGQAVELAAESERTPLQVRGDALAPRAGPLISGVEQTPASAASRRYIPGSDGRGVFVPARLGLPVKHHVVDIWSDWSEVNRLNIIGSEGADALERAFNVVARSRLPAITQTLVRRGIAISFGAPEDFVGAKSAAIAFLHYSRDHKPPAAPTVLPEIKFNPKFQGENPLVLAAALVHEGTHVQQYLEGTLLSVDHLGEEFEFDAWWNEAAFWEEVRGQVWPLDTPLERELEFGYQTALQGEARMRELLVALERR